MYVCVAYGIFSCQHTEQFMTNLSLLTCVCVCDVCVYVCVCGVCVVYVVCVCMLYVYNIESWKTSCLPIQISRVYTRINIHPNHHHHPITNVIQVNV